jgi:hypothetical protein
VVRAAAIPALSGECLHGSSVAAFYRGSVGGSKEAEVREAFFAREAGGKFQMADPSGVWIDVTDE